MNWVRNLLISIGAYWLSRQPVALIAWLFGKLSNGIIYGDSMFSAIAMGMMDSMGRAVCAALGAAIVTLAVSGAMPQLWALVVALLYVLASPPHYHWVRPPTAWDRVSQVADLLWPAIVCLAVASLISRRRNSRLGLSKNGRENVEKANHRKRHWGRLAWVGITNIAACASWIALLGGIRQAFPNVGLLLSSNDRTVFFIALAVAGLFLEILKLHIAAFVNCGLWLVVLIQMSDGVTLQGVPLLPLLFLAVDCVWYVTPAFIQRNRVVSGSIGSR